MRTLSTALIPCPAWCAARHDHTDTDGVLHASTPATVPGQHGTGLEVRAVAYVAPQASIAPVVEVNRVTDGGASYECADLTPAEALQLAEALIRAARLAMGDVPAAPGRVRALAQRVAACTRFGGAR